MCVDQYSVLRTLLCSNMHYTFHYEYVHELHEVMSFITYITQFVLNLSKQNLVKKTLV